ncbi:MAG: hypothetical protein RL088_2718 [Verrucomicrobiota bacterium]
MRHAFRLSPAPHSRKLAVVNAHVRHIYISPGHNFYGRYGSTAGTHEIAELDEVRCIAGRGLEGDRFFDYKADYKGQATFFAIETWQALCAQFGISGKGPEVFRRNIITEGLDLPALIGVEFEVQGIRFAGTQEATPCEWMDQAFCPGAHEALKGRGGLRARILSDGILRPGPI